LGGIVVLFSIFITVSRYIANLILQGEGLTLDFKHSITDSRKIARSLVAFANTKGGTLLIGVKDNGNVSGVNSDEEYYMIEAASQLYCKPKVPFGVTKWDINGKTVLEVNVTPSKRKPHKAPDKLGSYKAYIRVNDENVLASPIQLKIWKAEKIRKPIKFRLTETENLLLDYLKANEHISIAGYSRLAFIPMIEAENTLIALTAMDILEYHNEMNEDVFSIKKSD